MTCYRSILHPMRAGWRSKKNMDFSILCTLLRSSWTHKQKRGSSLNTNDGIILAFNSLHQFSLQVWWKAQIMNDNNRPKDVIWMIYIEIGRSTSSVHSFPITQVVDNLSLRAKVLTRRFSKCEVMHCDLLDQHPKTVGTLRTVTDRHLSSQYFG
jgi:hypothetical protein